MVTKNMNAPARQKVSAQDAATVTVLWDSFRTVSYTHLDVYKRQPQNQRELAGLFPRAILA